MIKTLFFLAVLAVTYLPLVTSEEFNYDEGGNDWTGFCANGTVQSPIDILPTDTVCEDPQLFNLYFMHGSQTFTVIDTGETLQATTNLSALYATASTGVFSGYQSLQFHFHAPSEHTIDGKHMDLEMHFVHSITSDFSSRGETKQTLAVVGIFFEEDNNAEANPFIEAMDFGNIDKTGVSRTIDLSEILLRQIPTPLQYFTYQGSLTTPPCTETVNWYVLATPLKIKKSELQLITSRYAGNQDFAHGNGNDRLVKPLNGRIVKRGGTHDCVGTPNGVIFSDWGIAGIVIGSVLFGATVVVLTFVLRKKIGKKEETSNQQTEPLIAANV